MKKSNALPAGNRRFVAGEIARWSPLIRAAASMRAEVAVLFTRSMPALAIGALAIATLLVLALWDPDAAAPGDGAAEAVPRATLAVIRAQPVPSAAPVIPWPEAEADPAARAAPPDAPPRQGSADPATQIDAPARAPLAVVVVDSAAPVPEPDAHAN
jgi:hypothetical protein